MDIRACLAVLAVISLSMLPLAAVSVAEASVDAASLPCAKPDGRVSASTISSGVAYIGGSFTHVTDREGVPQPRARLAAIDMSTCDVLPWAADADGAVYALQAVGGTIYAGGAFTTVGGQPRTRLAALAGSDGTVLSFSASIDRPVRALASTGSTLYVGGTFTKVDGAKRARLAAFDVGTGSLLTTWSPTAQSTVQALAASADGQDVYVGGSFTALDGNTGYENLGAVDAATGALDTGFTPGAPFPVLTVAADSRGVYAGGGGVGGHLGIWNLDGSLQQPIYQTDNAVQAVAVAEDSVYAGGRFMNDCVGSTGSGSPFQCDQNLTRHKLLEISLASGEVTDWAPSLNSTSGVFTELVDPQTGDLWVGGDFTTIDNQVQRHLGVFAADVPTQTVPSAPSIPRAEPGDNTVSLTWQAPSNDGGSSIQSYQIYRATTGTPTLLATAATLSFTDGTAMNGVTYRYAVSAVNASGESPLSGENTVTPTSATAVALWHLDEQSGATVMADSSGFGHDGLVSSDVQLGVPGADVTTGTAYSFTGPSSMVRVPDDPGLNPGAQPLNISAYLNVPADLAPGDYNVLQKGTATAAGGAYKLEINADAPGPRFGYPDCAFNSSGAKDRVYGPQPINDGTWHRVECHLTAAEAYVTVDGISGVPVARHVGSIANTIDLTFGGKPNDTHYFEGCADEVSIAIG